ncbi:hypothetical protein ACH4E8_14135 [Streptomyces sp. NPDC017979]|uniref:hypothetical protein n=1 Tax=Streptomyces sp. NPDC017979 TaxID=3365024 RepID=UPI0037B71D34
MYVKRTALRTVGVSPRRRRGLRYRRAAANAVTAAPTSTAVLVPVNAHQSTTSPSTPADVTPQSIRSIWNAIKNAGLAKKGYTGFMRWVDSLSNFNPIKWAIKAMPNYMVMELIDYIIRNY